MKQKKTNFLMMLLLLALLMMAGTTTQSVQAEVSVAQVELTGEMPAPNPEQPAVSEPGKPHQPEDKGQQLKHLAATDERLPQTGDAVQLWYIVIGIEILMIVLLSALLVHGRSRRGGQK
ncbi:LPXTG cell wall anchor domain-containing protein [Lactobacillus rhamnosus]|uniref:LPXTG cell wall anchor domain-containing protein n=1 Tax=Lacticaseibacillus rhamnosus TaxID=47715 RepID=A0A7Y7UJ66_LACRH|nr:LPXTG cell wall anchor domain-containing protein [Lacticaseibacillus rhamnosus]NVO87551.1 LPXTG cell wall anchor domain-containing protein [Lacticaseibacillus rhamnosus]